MAKSPLQEPFLRELAESFVATQSRIERRLVQVDPADASARNAIIGDELRGLYHGILVTFDGGSGLADEGLVSIVDENGVPFERFLHEIGFNYWPSDELQ